MRMNFATIATAVAVSMVAVLPARAQLVVGGETISDAKTFDAAKKDGKLLVYTTYPADSMKPILDAFKADTGVAVEFVRLPTQNMYQRTVAEFAAGKLEADYVDLTDLPLIDDLISKGILTVPHKVPAFDQIAADNKDPQGRWYGIIRIISVIAANMSRVSAADLPKSWKDLLNPKWKGVIGTPNIDAGGSAFVLHSFLREKVDPDYWKKFAAQSPKQYPAVGPLTNDIARGEVALAIGAISEPALLQIKAGAPLKVIFPTEGIPAFPAAGGITSVAKNPNAAALLLDWMTSKHGGDVIAKAGAYGANPGAGRPRAEGLDYPPVEKVWNLNTAQWVKTREPWMKEWREIFGVK